MVLDPSEYDASYFDGKTQALRHNAGYSKYERWYRISGENSSGEFFKDQAGDWLGRFNLSGKKILDVGCAKGFHVEDLRALGVDAWGVDVSSYAIGEAAPAIAPYLEVADIRTRINTYGNKEWDVIFSARFLECIDEADLPALIDGFNKKSHRQVHIIDEEPNSVYYLARSLGWWSQLPFARGTVLVGRESGEVVVV